MWYELIMCFIGVFEYIIAMDNFQHLLKNLKSCSMYFCLVNNASEWTALHIKIKYTLHLHKWSDLPVAKKRKQSVHIKLFLLS